METTGFPPATVADVVAALERRFPPAWAESWDRVGLVLGEPDAPVTTVACVVDCVPETVAEARAAGAEMIVAHHPLLLRGVSSVAPVTYKGRIVHDLIRNGHRALRRPHQRRHRQPRRLRCPRRPVRPARPAPVAPGAGRHPRRRRRPRRGRVGELPRPMTLAELTRYAAAVLPATVWGVRAAGDPQRVIDPCRQRRCGRQLPGQATASGADAYLTADLRHHPVSEHLAGGGPALLDASHWATERPWLDPSPPT